MASRLSSILVRAWTSDISYLRPSLNGLSTLIGIVDDALVFVQELSKEVVVIS
jgi:hypothetical protein